MAKDNFRHDFDKYLNSRLNKKEENVVKIRKRKSKKYDKKSVESLFFEEVVMQENDVGIIKRGESRLRRYLRNNLRRKKEIEFIETHFNEDEVELGHEKVGSSKKSINIKEKLNKIFQKPKSQDKEIEFNEDFKEFDEFNLDDYDIDDDFYQEFNSQKVPLKFKRKNPKSHVKIVDLETKQSSIKLGINQVRNVFINLYYHFSNRPDRFGSENSLSGKVVNHECNVNLKHSFEDAKEILSNLATTISELSQKEKMQIINDKDFKYLLSLDESINQFEKELETIDFSNEDKDIINSHKQNLSILKDKIKSIKKFFKKKTKSNDFEINLGDFEEEVDLKEIRKKNKIKAKKASRLEKKNKSKNSDIEINLFNLKKNEKQTQSKDYDKRKNNINDKKRINLDDKQENKVNKLANEKKIKSDSKRSSSANQKEVIKNKSGISKKSSSNNKIVKTSFSENKIKKEPNKKKKVDLKSEVKQNKTISEGKTNKKSKKNEK